MWCEQYTPTRSKTPAEWAEEYGLKTITAIMENKPLEVIGWHARLAGSFARIAMEKAEQEQRNQAHRHEIARAFSTLGDFGHLHLSLTQELEDRLLTAWLEENTFRRRDAHLGAVEES